MRSLVSSSHGGRLFDTDSPVALVTGSGAARVGNAIARDLSAAGCRVVLHARTSIRDAESTAAELKEAGHEPLVVQGDVGVESDVGRMFAQIDAKHGRLDVLVNAAAIYNRKQLNDVTADDVLEHFKANALGTFLCCQQASRRMVRQSTGGAIINVCDWAISRPYRDFAAYFPSKGAVDTMTRSLAVECAELNRRVRVNAIMPGPVLFPADMPDADRQAQVDGTLVKQAGSPEDVAHAVRFLIENEFVTGICLPVDGGCTIYAGPGTDQHYSG